MMDIARALIKARPGERFVYNGSDYDSIVWFDTTDKPTLAELEAAWTIIEAEQTQHSLVAAVQNHLDSAAKQYGYDDIKSAVTYAEEPAVPKFQTEGQRFRAWRSLVWAACYAILADVLDGRRQVPTEAELITELPKLTL